MKISIVAIFLSLYINALGAKVICKIPEASGICYKEKTDTLIVANDEGWIYEINTNGKILKKHYLGKYDLEGVAYLKHKNKLLFIAENSSSILVINTKTFSIEKEVKIKKKYKDVKILSKSIKNGIEAITVIDKEIYLSNQSTKKWPKDNPSVIFKIDGIENKKAKIVDIYNHGYIDIAGLSYHNNILYMTSDKKNLLIKYDIKKRKTIQKIKLPKAAQEGICFDNKGNMYIADDNGRILKYKEK